MRYPPTLRRFSRGIAPFSALAALALVVLCSRVGAATMTLSWVDNSSNELGFTIERATGTSGAFSVIANTAANATSFADTNLPASTSFRYRVCAYNAAGNSAYTNIVSATTPASASNTAPTLSAIADKTIAEDATTGALAITVGDAETAAGSLSLSATSSNSALVPATAISFGGSGANRTLTLRPAANQSGTATMTVKVSDGLLSATRSFQLTVSAVNDAPAIGSIAGRTVTSGASSGPIAFGISDPETSADKLTVAASSSNQTLLPNSAISLGGSGANRTISLTPAAGRTGTVSVTVRVSDGSASASTTFAVTVASAAAPSANTAPTISSIADQTVGVNASTAALAFTIGDAQTSAADLKLIVNASNKDLVPLSNITLGGSGANRTVTVRPLSNTTGWSTIWVKVSDGSLTKTISFVVNVSAILNYADIGSPALAGSQTITGGTIEMTAGGKDIWGTSDQFRFGSLPLPGDSELTVRVGSVTRSDDSAKAGLMYRASTAANAACVFLAVTPTNRIGLLYRTSSGAGMTPKLVGTTTLPRWLKLTRSGDTFYAFHSADGVTWSLFDFVTVDLPDTALAGLALTSHNAAATTTARFDTLTID